MKQNKTVRIGVVGCGFYAQNHLHAWSDLRAQGAVLAAVCDLDSKKAKAAGEAFGAPWFTDIDEMLAAADLDLVDIATQMRSHREIARKISGAGLAAIVQKPLAPTLEDAIDIVEFAKSQKTWLSVHENFRFSTVMQRVKSEIDSGSIGTPNWSRISFRTAYDIYSGQPYLMEEEQLAILDTGTHLLDLARFFLGEVAHISCETQRRNPNVKGEDTATMLLRHTNGAVSVVETTYQAKRIPDSFPETLLEIEGDNGSVILSRGETMTVTSDGSSHSSKIGSDLLPWTSQPWHGSQEAVLNANAHYLESFRNRRQSDTSGEDNLKTCALVDAAYQANREKPANIPEFK